MPPRHHRPARAKGRGAINPHAYQHEKVSSAIHYLILPDVPFEKKLPAAMAELFHAFEIAMKTPSESAFGHYDKIAQIMGHEGQWQERAATLTPSQRNDIITAFWELDRAVSRDYFSYEARR